MNRKTVSTIMIILTIIITAAATTVLYMAVKKEAYIIATIMGIVIIGQAANFILWRKKSR